MKYSLLLLLTAGVAVAQQNPRQQLQSAFLLEQQGRFNQVITTIEPLVRSSSGQSNTAAPVLTGHELANACTMLGVAYEGAGRFSDAQRAYDRALLLLENDPQHSLEYAAALENYGRLYSNLGQLDAAEPLWLQALEIRQQNADHTSATRSLTDLAGLALARNNVRQAHEYLERASEEKKLADSLVDDDLVVFAETGGWLALSEGRAGRAVVEYQRALEICRRVHGEHHWLVGWEHLLLGKAYAQAGEQREALTNMEQGLAIIEAVLGSANPKSVAAQLAYAQLLDQSGARTVAARLRSQAEQASRQFYGSQCAGCTVNKTAFR